MQLPDSKVFPRDRTAVQKSAYARLVDRIRRVISYAFDRIPRLAIPNTKRLKKERCFETWTKRLVLPVYCGRDYTKKRQVNGTLVCAGCKRTVEKLIELVLSEGAILIAVVRCEDCIQISMTRINLMRNSALN